MTSNGPGPREPTPGRNPTLGPEPAIGMGMPALDFQSRSQTEGRHPAVQDAAVVGVPDATWGEAGVAFVVLGGSKEVTAANLNALLAARLAKYKIPKDFIFVESLPRTSYGNVTKAELREAYLCSGSNAPDHSIGIWETQAVVRLVPLQARRTAAGRTSARPIATWRAND